MTVRWIFAALHLLALGIGLGAIGWRVYSLRGNLDPSGIKRVLFADNLWGFAALLWISTGLVRAFGGLEKGSEYYLNSNTFWVKMALLGVILLLEIMPATRFMQLRLSMRRGIELQLDPNQMKRFATISTVQAVLVVAMVFTATAIARGLGF